MADPRLVVTRQWEMAVDIHRTSSPQEVLDRAGDFLATDPVRHNVILTLLHARVANPTAGRYVIAGSEGRVIGLMFHSPLTFIATLTPMPVEAVDAIVEVVASDASELPGVAGEAATAARFAGHWTEKTKSAAFPQQGQRIYEIEEVTSPSGVAGASRPADMSDELVIAEWLRGFRGDTGEPVDDSSGAVRRAVAGGAFSIWDDGRQRSMAALTAAVARVARVQAVYTPPESRGHGFASANVAALSNLVLERGDRCILYTDLGNPTSNAVYRRLGYRAVCEVTRYRFDQSDIRPSSLDR